MVTNYTKVSLINIKIEC